MHAENLLSVPGNRYSFWSGNDDKSLPLREYNVPVLIAAAVSSIASRSSGSDSSKMQGTLKAARLKTRRCCLSNAHRHAVWVAALVAGVLLPLASIRSDQHSEPWPVTVSYTPSASVPSEPNGTGCGSVTPWRVLMAPVCNRV
jgi:hypothetical protein